MQGRVRTPHARWAFALALTLAACAQEPIGAAPQAVRVPGDWNPPASTREIAATQYVDVVDPPTFELLERLIDALDQRMK